MTRGLVAGLLAALALAGSASASETRPTLAELEREVVCPSCHTTLNLSHSPVADRMRAFIRARIAAGDTKSEIKEKLVDEFGEVVLAAPPARGFNVLAWALPLAAAVLGSLLLALLARRWVRTRTRASRPDASTNGRGAVDPELERRLDEELARFEA